MNGFDINLIIKPLTLPVITMLFLLAIIYFIKKKINCFTFQKIVGKIFTIFKKFFLIGVPIFILRQVIICILDLDHDSFLNLDIIFILAAISIDFYLSPLLNTMGADYHITNKHSTYLNGGTITMMNSPDHVASSSNTSNNASTSGNTVASSSTSNNASTSGNTVASSANTNSSNENTSNKESQYLETLSKKYEFLDKETADVSLECRRLTDEVSNHHNVLRRRIARHMRREIEQSVSQSTHRNFVINDDWDQLPDNLVTTEDRKKDVILAQKSLANDVNSVNHCHEILEQSGIRLSKEYKKLHREMNKSWDLHRILIKELLRTIDDQDQIINKNTNQPKTEKE